MMPAVITEEIGAFGSGVSLRSVAICHADCAPVKALVVMDFELFVLDSDPTWLLGKNLQWRGRWLNTDRVGFPLALDKLLV